VILTITTSTTYGCHFEKLVKLGDNLVALVRKPDNSPKLATAAKTDRLKKQMVFPPVTNIRHKQNALGISILERFMAKNCVIPNTHAKLLG
jgi:hypothetical protein